MIGVASMQTWVADNRKELKRFLKFFVVGLSGTAVDFGILNLLVKGLGWPIVLSNTVSFSTAVLNNFTWNRYWTYPDSRSKPIHAQLRQFVIVNVVGWAINTAILTLLKDPLMALAINLNVTPATAYTIGYNAAKVAATGVVLFWNFFVNRYWTYNDVE